MLTEEMNKEDRGDEWDNSTKFAFLILLLVVLGGFAALFFICFPSSPSENECWINKHLWSKWGEPVEDFQTRNCSRCNKYERVAMPFKESKNVN